jgi:hypothetical protein
MKPAPRPSNWTRNKMMEWLEENPVGTTTDIQFLTFQQVLRLQEISVRMQLEQQQFLTMNGISSAAVLVRCGNRGIGA